MIAERDRRLLQKDQRIAALEEFIRLQKLQRIATKFEKTVDQADMFNEAELCDMVTQALIE